MLYFAAHTLCNYSGVMVTGSHNPPDYNGLKMVLGGETLAADAIQGLRARLENEDFTYGSGDYREHDIAETYLQRITGDVGAQASYENNSGLRQWCSRRLCA